MDSGIKEVMPPPKTWAASMVGLSQGLSTPRLALGSGVKYVGLEHSHWEISPLCTPPQRLSAGNVPLCDATCHRCVHWWVHCCWTRPHSESIDNGLQ